MRQEIREEEVERNKEHYGIKGIKNLVQEIFFLIIQTKVCRISIENHIVMLLVW